MIHVHMKLDACTRLALLYLVLGISKLLVWRQQESLWWLPCFLVWSHQESSWCCHASLCRGNGSCHGGCHFFFVWRQQESSWWLPCFLIWRQWESHGGCHAGDGWHNILKTSCCFRELYCHNTTHVFTMIPLSLELCQVHRECSVNMVKCQSMLGTMPSPNPPKQTDRSHFQKLTSFNSKWPHCVFHILQLS